MQSIPDPEQYSPTCQFCKIIQGQGVAQVVFEDSYTLAFLDARPLFPGHTLVVPRWHIPTMADLPDNLIEPLFKSARLLAQAVEEAMQVEGSFMAMNNKVSQSVPHLHVHIVPRRKNDGLKGFFWPRRPYKDEQEMLEVQAAIRAQASRLQAGK